MAEPNEPSQAEIPRRELHDPRALRAYAHPVRLRIMEELADAGQATATELAERIGESAANCSWHLRQLARYGFIEEAGGGTGRQRPWSVIVQTTSFGRAGGDDVELALAGDAAAEVILAREVEAFRAWRAVRREAPQEWRDASFLEQSWDWLTADELAELKKDLDAVIERHIVRHINERKDPAQRPPGARMVRLIAWGIPGGPETATPPADNDPPRAA